MANTENMLNLNLESSQLSFLGIKFYCVFSTILSLKYEANDITSAKYYACIFCVVSRKFNRNILLYFTEYRLL